MKHEVILDEKPVTVTISRNALKRLQTSTTPLLMEVELYFSCLIRKACHFRQPDDVSNYVRVMDGLYIHFRATMTSRCSIEDFDKQQAADFPIVNRKPYIPRWVNLDFSSRGWAGDFGYAE